MLHNKKASIEWNLTTIGGLLIAALVAITLLHVAGTYTQPGKIESALLAKDLALELDVLYASPYDVTYQHPVFLETRSVLLEGNEVKIIPRTDNAVAEQRETMTSFQHQYFFGTQDVLVLDNKILTTPIVFASKKGNIITLHDGTLPLPELTTQIVGLSDVSIAVETDAQGSADAPLLNNLQQQLVDALRNTHFPLASESDATIIILLSFSDESEHYVYYSTRNAQTVQLLASNTQAALDGLIQPLIGGEQTYTYPQAVMEVALGKKHPSFDTLRDTDNQRTIALALTSTIQRTYPNAKPELII